jgi:hypothetical protein
VCRRRLDFFLCPEVGLGFLILACTSTRAHERARARTRMLGRAEGWLRLVVLKDVRVSRGDAQDERMSLSVGRALFVCEGAALGCRLFSSTSELSV